jgi:hypothetical protein
MTRTIKRPGGIRSKLSYSNVLATISLFAVLGGGAYAASKIGPSDIAKNAVHSKHIKTGQVKGPDVRNNSLGLEKTTEFTDVVTHDFATFAQGSCQAVSKDVFRNVNNFDQVVVVPDSADSAWTDQGLIALGGAVGSASADQIRLRVCNVGATLDPPSTTFSVFVFRGPVA